MAGEENATVRPRVRIADRWANALGGSGPYVATGLIWAFGGMGGRHADAATVLFWGVLLLGLVAHNVMLLDMRLGLRGVQGWVIVQALAAATLPWTIHVSWTLLPFTTAVIALVHAFGLRWALAACAAHMASAAFVVGEVPLWGLFYAVNIFGAAQQNRADRHAREVALAHEELVAAHAELVAAHRELETAQARLARATRDEERVRIARDLHDVIGHGLTGLTLQLEVASHVTTGPAADAVGRARSAAKDLLGDVRAVVDRLREQHDDLAAELRDMADAVPHPHIDLHLGGDLGAVDDARAEVVLRSVQEGITNAVRHGRASAMLIEVARMANGLVTVQIQNDGPGPDGPIVPGNGLTGMRERVVALGGNLDYWASERGFFIDIELPGRAA